MNRPLPLAFIERIAAGSLRVWLIVGILLRITRLRDYWRPLAFVFYTTPWPAIAFGLLILALHARRLGHAHHRRRYILLSGGALFTWFALSWQSGAEVPEPRVSGPPLRLVSWNTGHPVRRLPLVFRSLRGQDADLMAIAEGGYEQGPDVARWTTEFPGYQVVAVRGQLMCLARGEIRVEEQGKLAPASFYGLYRARIRDEDYTILQADISPRDGRLAPLRRLTEIAQAHASEKLIVLGDLNTPRESVGFDALRGFLVHSFEKAGTGLAETWPSIAPALSIDHVWSSAALPPSTCRIGWTVLSDHRPVTVEFGGGRR